MAEKIPMKAVRFERAVSFTEPTVTGAERFKFNYTPEDARNRTVIEIPEWLYDELIAERKAFGRPKILAAKEGSVVDHVVDGMLPKGTPLSDEDKETKAKRGK